MKISGHVKIRVEPFRGIPSPYDGMEGTVVGEKTIVNKNNERETVFLVRLDKPHRAGFEIVGFPAEALSVIKL